MIKVSEEVYEGLETVRESGETNMFDYNSVIAIASREGYVDTVVWLMEHKNEYIQGVFQGFEVA